jgi:hypothetical protein
MGSRHSDDTFFRSSVGIIVFLFVTCWFASLIDADVLVFCLIWCPALVYIFLKQPVHIAARVLLLLGLVLEGPEERAGNGYWVPPFAPANRILLSGINKWTSIPGISFSLFTVLCIVLLVRARKLRWTRGVHPSVECRNAMYLYFLGIAVSVVWGLARGGKGQPIFWQLIYPITAAIAALAFIWAIRGKQDLRALGTVIVVVALTKAFLVVWVYQIVCRPLNIKPFYATTHSDSVNFASGFAVLLIRSFEERSKVSIRNLLLLAPILVIAVYMNNRRLAFVSMGASLLLSILMMKSGKVKQRIIVGALTLSPLVAGYFLAGASSNSPFFALAKAFSTVTSSSDSSSETRDIENYNLYITLKHAPLAGTGFGNEYEESVVADDISGGHPLYRYIPHNSVLWLVSVGGILVFPLIWLPNSMLAFLAYRAYRNAPSPTERAAGLTSACMLFIYMFQAWGDMGVDAYTPGVIFAVAYAVAGRIEGDMRLGASNAIGRRPAAA